MSERNPLLTAPRVMAGLCELGAHAGEDARKAAVLLALLRGESKEGPGLPNFEEIRNILGLASPVLMTAEDETSLIGAVQNLCSAAARFESLIQRLYYGRKPKCRICAQPIGDEPHNADGRCYECVEKGMREPYELCDR